jgi:hypothetical protein
LDEAVNDLSDFDIDSLETPELEERALLLLTI